MPQAKSLTLAVALATAAALSAGLCIVQATAAEAATDLAQICAQVACRPESKPITLRVKDGRTVEFQAQPAPYVHEGAIAIFPDEALIFSVSVADGKVSAPVFLRVDDGSGAPAPKHDPAATRAAERSAASATGMIFLSFVQQPGDPGMFLKIVNTLPVNLKYDAVMFGTDPINQSGPMPTSSCAVLSNFSVFESWPHPIMMLLLNNFRLEPESNQVVCK